MLTVALLYVENSFNSNKQKLSRFFNGHHKAKIETITESKYSY